MRSFDNEDIEDEKFAIKSSRLAEKTKQEGYLGSFYWPALIMVSVTSVAFGLGLHWVSQDVMTAGQLTSALTFSTPAALTAATKSAGVPVPLMVTVTGVVTSDVPG